MGEVDTLGSADPEVVSEIAKSVIRVDSMDGDGIPEARRKILSCVAAMPEVGLELPPSWILVKRHTETLRQKSSSKLYLHLDEAYNDFLESSGGDNDSSAIAKGVKSLEDYAEAVRFWHKIGEVYVFQDLLFADPVKVFTLVRTVVRHADDHRKPENRPDRDNATHQADFAMFLDDHILTIEECASTRDAPTRGDAHLLTRL